MPPDYAFMGPYSYCVDQRKYDKHRSYEYERFVFVPDLLKLLQNMSSLSSGARRLLWDLVATKTSKPVVRLSVTNYDKLDRSAAVDFFLDTGADVSSLTAKTADLLGINRDLGANDPMKIKGIGGGVVVGLPRWIYVFLGGRLHPIPILVPPADETVAPSQNAPRQWNFLGRAAIASAFLMCFDNKRLYAFARRASEPSLWADIPGHS
jgi:hypothetical protein